ncbi:TPA: DNA-directed RNA polymerase subunit A'', partial [Candidatus Woesearchaeota archaeon]|nr:DNA-directed RNA polymerase subunit A'' [Candidatus Woesearchaeota archaeon]
LYKLKEKIKEIHISGIKEVRQVLPVRRGEEFIIITAGSNLKAAFECEFVDPVRTSTNDIHEVSSVLGIEAARQSIINEVFKVIENQGLNIDKRHMMLVADMMCNGGDIKGITRYGVVSQKSSVLARASFETPIKHIISAALVGEEDTLSSVVENVMLNQPVPVGTGLPGLQTKVK